MCKKFSHQNLTTLRQLAMERHEFERKKKRTVLGHLPLHHIKQMHYTQVADIESFWVWLQSGVLPTLYYSTWYNNMADQEWVIMGNKNSWLVGSPTLRQVRLDSGKSWSEFLSSRCLLKWQIQLITIPAVQYKSGVSSHVVIYCVCNICTNKQTNMQRDLIFLLFWRKKQAATVLNSHDFYPKKIIGPKVRLDESDMKGCCRNNII